MTSEDEMIVFLTGQAPFSGLLNRSEKLARSGGLPLLTKAAVDRSLMERLHTSVDGQGLRWHNLVPSINKWVADGTSLLTGADYIHAVKIRGNL